MAIVNIDKLKICQIHLSAEGFNDWASELGKCIERVERERLVKNVSKKQEQKRKKSLGLCRVGGCKNKIIFPSTNCEVHKEIIRRESAKKYREQKEKNICPRCHNPLLEGMDDGYVHCLNCRQRNLKIR